MLFSYLYILILCSYTQFTNAVPAEGAPVTDPNYKVYVSGNDQITGDGSTRIYDPDARNAALVREGYGSTGFPPDSWLGYALDMRKGAGLNTLQWNIVENNVKRGRYLIKLDGSRTWQKVGSAGTQWEVPDHGVSIQNDLGSVVDYEEEAVSGTEMAGKLSEAAEAQGQIKIVEGDASVNLNLAASFKESHVYVLHAWLAEDTTATLADYTANASRVNVDFLQTELDSRPDQITDLAGYKLWESFFHEVGTHVIIRTSYGARMQMSAHADNSDKEVDAKFSEDVGFKFVGIPIGVKGINISAEAQYKSFESSLKKELEPRGGDTRIASKFTSNPFAAEVPAEWNQWVDSALAKPDVMGLGVDSLWSILRIFPDKKTQDLADKIENAWDWFANAKIYHYTDALFEIEAGWGSVEMLTEGTFENIVNATTGETWHRGPSWLQWTAAPNMPKATLKFTIKNLGGPITIATQRADGGTVTFVIPSEDISRTNDKPRDESLFALTTWYNIPVNPTGQDPVFTVTDPTATSKRRRRVRL